MYANYDSATKVLSNPITKINNLPSVYGAHFEGYGEFDGYDYTKLINSNGDIISNKLANYKLTADTTLYGMWERLTYTSH